MKQLGLLIVQAALGTTIGSLVFMGAAWLFLINAPFMK